MNDKEYGAIQNLYERIEFLEDLIESYKELLEEQRLTSVGYRALVQDLFEFKRMENDE